MIGRGTVSGAGLVGGPVIALVVYAILPDSYVGDGGSTVEFGHPGRATAAIAVWMAVWWMTEAISIFATALIPLATLPLFGAASIRASAAPYGHELIYLFMGGFILALAMQRWGLHRRIALTALARVGDEPRRIIGAFMAVTALLSMWVSNTATAIMMLPIALSVIDARGHEPGDDTLRHFATALLLGVAYGASIGGIGTLIGTPPNLFLASFAKSELGVEIGFLRWMGVGVPLVLVFLPTTWWLLTTFLHPVGRAPLGIGAEPARTALASLGPMHRGERITLAVFLVTALAWITRPLLVEIEVGGATPLAGLTDPGIAIACALTLFVAPVDWRERRFAMDWDTARELPWGLLVLFGGGLSLAAAIRANGVGELIGHQATALQAAPEWLVIAGITALVIFLTELTSNTATTATLIPILAGLAPALGASPMMLAVPAAIAASCAFMLPVATPPNAIVFGSGRLTIPEMCRAGLALNLLGVVLITGLAYAAVLPLLARLS